MRRPWALWTFCFLWLPAVLGFASTKRSSKKRRTFVLSAVPRQNNIRLPTIKQLTTDAFLDQVQHGHQLVQAAVHDNDNNHNNCDTISELIQAQWTHSEGIRGFFVSYLTREGDDDDDDKNGKIPLALQMALNATATKEEVLKDLIPLACMNVVMPTAMKTLHQDKSLQASSAKTSNKARQILVALGGRASNSLEMHVQAILKVAEHNNNDDNNNAELDDDLRQYWTTFFEKWGYGPTQRQDIAQVMHHVQNQLAAK